MAFETIRFEIRDGIGYLTLNRPQALNALTLQAVDELHAVFRQLSVARGKVRALLITGEGKGFCSGADLIVPRPVDPDNPKEGLRDYFNPTFQLLRNLEMPTVAAVNGACAGGGMSLALSCDLVIAARSAYFLSAFVNIGLVPDVGASWMLTNILGEARAAAFMLLGERVPAETAERWGLIWKCVEDAQLKSEADKVVQKFAQGPTQAYLGIRKLVKNARSSTLDSQLLMEGELQRVLLASHDGQEARRAFAEKRPPKFTGS